MRYFSLVLFFCLAILSIGAKVPSSKSQPRYVMTVESNGKNEYRAISAKDEILKTGNNLAEVVNAAIAKVSQQNGGTVMIAAGDYTLDQPIKVMSGVRLIGEGGLIPNYQPLNNTLALVGDAANLPQAAFQAHSHKTRLHAGKAMPMLVDMSEAAGARLEHLWLDGAKLADQCVKSAGYAIRIRDCAFTNARKSAVWFTAGPDPEHDTYVQGMLINSYVADCPVGCEIGNDPAIERRGGYTDGSIVNCCFERISDYAANSAGGWQYMGNLFIGPMKTGIIASGSPCMINNNVFQNFAERAPIRVESRQASITGNRWPGVKQGLDEKFLTRNGGKSLQTAIDNSDTGAIRTDSKAGPLLYPLNYQAASPSGIIYVARAAGDAAGAIQRAIDEAASSGACVLIAAGTHSISKPLHLKPNVRLIGEGGMNGEGTQFKPYGTILTAGEGNTDTVVDLTDAPNASVEQLVVNGAGQAKNCVKIAARQAVVRDCFIQNAARRAVWFTNGPNKEEGAYEGMRMFDTLMHAGPKAACVVVSADPSTTGSLPQNGVIFNSRLKMGRVQAIFHSGDGWKMLASHSTSGTGSVLGIALLKGGTTLIGHYFDMVQGGPRLRIETPGVSVIGSHFHKVTMANRGALIKDGTNPMLQANTGQMTEVLNSEDKNIAEYLIN